MQNKEITICFDPSCEWIVIMQLLIIKGMGRTQEYNNTIEIGPNPFPGDGASIQMNNCPMAIIKRELKFNRGCYWNEIK